jgi:hypothetical protein
VGGGGGGGRKGISVSADSGSVLPFRDRSEGKAVPARLPFICYFIYYSSGNVDYSRILGLLEDSDVASAGRVGRFGPGLGLRHKP